MFDLTQPLDGLSKTNRWVRLADSLPWDKIEREYNERLNNRRQGAPNLPARLVVGALIIKHVENLSDEKTLQAIGENPYMQYFVGLSHFTEKQLFVPEVLVAVRKRLDHDFFNRLTLMLSQISSDKSKGGGERKGESSKGEDPKHDNISSSEHGGIMKVDATCCNAEMRYPTDCALLEDAGRIIHKTIKECCKLLGIKRPRTYRDNARRAFMNLTRFKRKSGQKIQTTKRVQLNCIKADIQTLMNVICKDICMISTKLNSGLVGVLKASFMVFHQQSEMFEQGLRSCADRIVSIFQPHIRPIPRGKAKANSEFGAKVGACIVNGYTYIDHLSWDAYNESQDLAMHIQFYKERFGKLPEEIQADRIYLNRENRALLKQLGIVCYNKPLGRPPKQENDLHKADRRRAHGERNEIESTFGTAKRIYGADNIRAKRPDTADTWIGACFFAKNIMKFLRGLLCLLFRKNAIFQQKTQLNQFYGNLYGLPCRNTCLRAVIN